MFKLIFWMCIIAHPDCPVEDTAKHMVFIYKTATREECEDLWKQFDAVPDPEGVKSRHTCTPIEEPI